MDSKNCRLNDRPADTRNGISEDVAADYENTGRENTSGNNKCPFLKIIRGLHIAVFAAGVITVTLFYATLVFTIAILSRKFARRTARSWNRVVLGLGGVKVDVIGKEKLDINERYVFMSNHQSALDIPIVYSGIGEQISFIAKKELFMIPIFGWSMWAIGHISIDRENARKAHASMAKAAEKLNRENMSLVLFPEGTRSKDGKVLDFKTGSFTLALQAGVKLVPVAIKGAIDRLPPKSARIVPGKVTLEIFDPIPVEELQGQSKKDICNKIHNTIKTMVEGSCGVLQQGN